MTSADPQSDTAAAGFEGATIFRVASESGVSITTVSHVFSGRRRVSTATRERVLAVAKQLDYHPTASARALATKRTMTIALQHSVGGPEDMINPFMGAMLTAMSEAAMRASYSFLFVPRGANSQIFVGPLVEDRRIDGAILVDPTADDPFVLALIERGVPVVSLGRIEGRPELLSIDHDIPALARMVLAHFAEAGYTRPALMSLQASTSWVQDTERTFREVAGVDTPIVQLKEFSERCAYDATLELLARTRPPDAIYCGSGLFAAGVVRAARAVGIAIPEQLGIVGAGDSPVSQGMNVPLSSVRVYPEMTGVRLLEALISLIEKPSPDGPAMPAGGTEPLPGELIVRQSTSRT